MASSCALSYPSRKEGNTKAWFDKALKSVQSTAEKAAFGGDKILRVSREEGVLSEMERKAQAKLVDLGKAALVLYRSGALADPGVAAVAAELAAFEEEIQKQKDKVEAIRNEEYKPDDETPGADDSDPAQAVAAVPTVAHDPVVHEPVETVSAEPGYAERVAPGSVDAEPLAPELALIKCPNCHAEIKATVTFCPECGSRVR